MAMPQGRISRTAISKLLSCTQKKLIRSVTPARAIAVLRPRCQINSAINTRLTPLKDRQLQGFVTPVHPPHRHQAGAHLAPSGRNRTHGGPLSLPRFFSFCKYIPNSFQCPRIQQRRSNRRHSCLHLAIFDSGNVEVGSSTGSQSSGSSPLPQAFLPIDSTLTHIHRRD